MNRRANWERGASALVYAAVIGGAIIAATRGQAGYAAAFIAAAILWTCVVGSKQEGV